MSSVVWGSVCLKMVELITVRGGWTAKALGFLSSQARFDIDWLLLIFFISFEVLHLSESRGEQESRATTTVSHFVLVLFVFQWGKADLCISCHKFSTDFWDPKMRTITMTNWAVAGQRPSPTTDIHFFFRRKKKWSCERAFALSRNSSPDPFEPVTGGLDQFSISNSLHRFTPHLLS